jgi:hypothetical protein
MCKELKLLCNLLDKKGVKWKDESDRILYPEIDETYYGIDKVVFEYDGNRVSAVNGFGTYGGFNHHIENQGLIELRIGEQMEPEGWLTAKDVMKLVFGGKK